MCVTVDHARAVGSKPFLGHRRAKTVRLKITGEKKRKRTSTDPLLKRRDNESGKGRGEGDRSFGNFVLAVVARRDHAQASDCE